MVKKITDKEELKKKAEAAVSDTPLKAPSALSSYNVDNGAARDMLVDALTKKLQEFEYGQLRKERTENVWATSGIYMEAAASRLAGSNPIARALKIREARIMVGTDTFYYWIGQNLAEIQKVLGREATLKVASIVAAFDSPITMPGSLTGITKGLLEVALYEPQSFGKAMDAVSAQKAARYAGSTARRLGDTARTKAMLRGEEIRDLTVYL